MKCQRGVGVAVMIVCMLVLPSCSSGNRSSAAFAPVNQAVSDVNPERLGQIVIDRASGSGRPLSQPPTRLVGILIEAPTGEADSRASGALGSAGFTKTGATGWQATKQGQLVVVFVTVVGPGGEVPGWSSVPGPQQAVVLLSFSRAT
jgi:hypothetical protein